MRSATFLQSALVATSLFLVTNTRADDDPLFRDKFLKRATTRALRKCLAHLAKRADVPLVPRPLHAFRHLCARNWLKEGLGDLAIQQLMRHSSLNTTRIYTQLDPAVAQQVERAHPLGDARGVDDRTPSATSGGPGSTSTAPLRLLHRSGTRISTSLSLCFFARSSPADTNTGGLPPGEA
jgi:hypothetical protein